MQRADFLLQIAATGRRRLFGLGRLAWADRRAASPAGDCFDFSQKPHRFVKIDAPLPPKFFMGRLPHDDLPPDEE